MPAMMDSLHESVLEGKPLQLPNLTDVHGHLDTPAKAGSAARSNFAVADRLWQTDLESLLASLNRIGIKRQIFSHFRALTAKTLGELDFAHQASLEVVSSYPERFRSYAVMNPQLGSDPSIAFNWLDKHPGAFVGIKVHGELHQHRLNDSRMADFWKLCSERSVPVLLHVNPEDDEDSLVRFLDQFPGCRILFAHLWPWRRNLTRLFQQFPALYTDTSLSYNQSFRLEETCQMLGSERVLFGSDSAYLDPGSQVAKVALSRLPESQKIAILTENYRGLFPDSIWK